MRVVFILVWSTLLLGGCSVIREKPAADPDMMELARKPLPPEKAEEVLSQAADNWFYGQGIGDTAITVGTVFAFPPYLAVVLGNAALNLSGYESVGVSSFLPEEQREGWLEAYDGVASAPGRATASIAGREFRTKDAIRDDFKAMLRENAVEQESKISVESYGDNRISDKTGN